MNGLLLLGHAIRLRLHARSYATGKSGYNRIDLKTNIKIKSAVMFTAALEGYATAC